MPVRTWVGRFCVVDGRVEEEGPWLGSLIRQRPDEDADELYVLVEPASDGSAEYTSQLVDVIARLYAKDPLSLTGALTRSLRAAHEHLREWNRTSLKEHHVGAGASCLALRGTDAYLAQVGPSLAYVLRENGEFRRIEAEQPDFEHSLGIGDEFEPRLARIKLDPGDLVVLASTRLETIAAEAHVRRILERGADDALPELYTLTRDEPNMAIVLLSCFEQADELPEYLTKTGETPLDDAHATADAIGVGTPAAAASSEPLAVGVAPDSPMDTMDAALGGFDAPRRPIQEQVREITQSTAPPPSTNVRLRGESANLRYKRTTGNIPLPQFQVPKLALFAAAAIVLLGLLVWWQLPRSVAESREEKFATLLADARENNATAQSTNDAGLKRQLLTDAQTMLADAENIHDDNGELIALKSDVAATLAVLDAVYEVNDFASIADLAQLVTGSLSVTDTVIGGGQAYLLDAEGRRVLRVPLDASSPPETVLSEGQPAGFVIPSRPVQIAWADETQSLVILDEQRQAFAYFPDRGALPITIRGADGWGSLDAIAASAGNLYLLDVEGNQVWRYLPGQGGFDSERTALLDAVTLEHATELAVGQDVYVLDSEAGIRRFSGKSEMPFTLSGIDKPLMSPASLNVLPGSNRIVVADRANKRIVLASAEGAFLRQIVSPSFTDLRAAYVDEGTNTIYVLNGDTLMKAPLPPG
jgi:serine/threonine protein phosphatase PrpC